MFQEYTIHRSVGRAGYLSKSLSRKIGLGLLVWGKKMYIHNSGSCKNVDSYNQIYKVMRKRRRKQGVASRMEKTLQCLGLSPGSSKVQALVFGAFNADLQRFNLG